MSDEQARRTYWETAPLAQARRSGCDGQHALEQDLRTRALEEARAWDGIDRDRARTIYRVGWRITCRTNRLRELREQVEALSVRQLADLHVFEGLCSGAANTDEPPAEDRLAVALAWCRGEG